MLKTYPPSLSLSGIVSCFWSLDRLESPHTELVYPAGKIQMIFHYGNPFLAKSSSGNLSNQPRFALCGQITTFSSVTAYPSSGMIACVLKPLAAASLIPFPPEEFTDRTEDLSDALRSWKNFSGEFEDCTSDISRIGVIERFLSEIYAPVNRCSSAFVRSCIDEIAQKGGTSLPFNSMKSFDYSGRSTERIFKRMIGISPKMYAEITRLEKCVDMLNSDRSLSAVSYDSGFYDQSHFTKTFRKYTGLTPLEFRNSL
jgi:hypothetical protein